uniref:Uncharacterized protein n=1 Tax=Tanacetum cinerariifolium TaxID=118510 RepID=A0A6L2NIP4_TANCI|nr:hypothetical protein [Tanacetum cinerariifolium]
MGTYTLKLLSGVPGRVMVAPTIPISVGSSEGNFECAIDIGVDVIHPEHLLGVPIQEEFSALRFRVDIVEAENASLRYTIRTIEAVETVTRNHERLARMKIKRQLASVQESQCQDREDFRKLKKLVTSQFGHHS